MLKIKRILILIFDFFIIYTLFFKCYASSSIPVTKENLNIALQEYSSSESNEENYKIKVLDNDITITNNEKDYILNYDLNEKPTFKIEIPIEKGMSYSDFEEKQDKLNLVMIGYMAVANIQGVDFEDSEMYFLMSQLSNISNNSQTSKNEYIIVDDTNLADGVTIVKDNKDNKTIYTSEFGDRVMEYVSSLYKEKRTIKDTTDGINSYEWTTERKEVTDTSCKIVSSLSVNIDAEFSTLKGYSESFLDKNITKENADYTIDLKVGQKCRIESDQKITGHELSGAKSEINQVNDRCIEITAKKTGKINGYIYMGEEKKSIFITVNKNTENKNLETVMLKINTITETEKINEDNQQKESNNIETDNTVSTSAIPKAGLENIIFAAVWLCLVLILICYIKLRKNKDIK